MSASSTVPPLSRATLTHWLDTTGRIFVENPLNALASAGLALSLYPAAKRQRGVYPRPLHLLLFAGAFAASGGMAYQGYTVDSATMMASWSALYLLVNRWKCTLGPVLRVRAVGPAVMGGKAVFDTVVYAWYRANTRQWEPDQEEEGRTSRRKNGDGSRVV